MKYSTILVALLLLAVALAVEYRTHDGTNNNKENPTWGAANTPFIKEFDLSYVDGFWKMDPNLPNPRDLSEGLFGIKPKDGGYSRTKKSNLHTGMGMANMHDIARGTAGSVNAAIPVGDNVFFNPKNTSGATMSFVRQACQAGYNTTNPNEPCKQRQAATSFLDLSIIYGVTQVHRDFSMERDAAGAVTGRLRVDNDPVFGEMLPMGTNNQFNLSAANPANLLPYADAIYTIFVREHNRLAAKIKAANPALTGMQIYEEARRWTIAYYQAVTFNEYYPATVGEPMPDYRGYQASVDPTTSAVFYSSMVRYGHSEIAAIVERRGEDGLTIPDGNLLLRDVFRTPKVYFSAGIEPVIRGGFSSLQQEVDLYYVDDMRIWAGVTPPALGRDTAALTIQRGRDLGLPNYNQFRKHIGLDQITHFENITSDATILAALKKFYPGGVNTVDFWVGALAEEHPGYHLGPSLRTIYKEQFKRLRDGDRFYYKSPDAGFTAAEIAEIDNTKLSTLVLRNTNIKSLPCSLFYVSEKWDCGESKTDSATLEQIYQGLEGKASLIGGAYSLSWKIQTDKKNVQFTMKAKTTGWVAFAVPKTAKQMIGSDIIAGWVDSTGKVTVEEYWAGSKEPCLGGNGVCKKTTASRISEVSGSEANGETTITFTRPIAAAGTNGNEGLALGFGVIDINVAFGTTDGPLSYHGNNKEAARLTILPPGGFDTTTASASSTSASLLFFAVISLALLLVF